MAVGRKLIKSLIIAALSLIVVLGGWAFVAQPLDLGIQATDLANMVHVDSGSFRVGKGTYESGGFWIDQFEVTERNWTKYRQSHGGPALNYPVFEKQRNPDFPVRWVSYPQAAAYAASQFKRIPSNLEWERAAQGPSGGRWPWGDRWTAAANVAEIWARGKGENRVTRVGLFERGRSPVGTYDMVGNVWEWTSSESSGLLFGTDDSVKVPDGHGAPVVRGGAFNSARPGSRGKYEKVENSRLTRAWDLGFRCVISDEEVEFQMVVFPLIRDLGWSDPWHQLIKGRRAAKKLAKLGSKTLPYLLAVREACRDGDVCDRIESVVTRIRKGS
ncbi:MAG: hypothetical protein ACI97A_001133 [Planctomycetota bacterium]